MLINLINNTLLIILIITISIFDNIDALFLILLN